MKTGLKSVLCGAHCFFLHPFFVAAAWWKLYGAPLDPRLWAAFMVHDIGYVFCEKMDDEKGELHPIVGARIMSFFDGHSFISSLLNIFFGYQPQGTSWHDFSLYHSRYLAKKLGGTPSRLCFADKLAFPLTPAWLYLPMVTATGEINEYLKMAQNADSGHWKPTGADKKLWHKQLCEYMTKWVYEHIDGREDTWTSANRHAKTNSGVTQ